MHHRQSSRRLTAVRLLLALVALTAGTLALFAPATAAPAAAARSDGGHPSGLLGREVVGEVAAAASVVPPVRLRVPTLGLDSTLARLGTDSAGALVPPADFMQAGWFTGAPAPGAIGPAVIAGHVDSWRGPAVFFRLAQLREGDDVLVSRADGTTLRFTVTRVGRYPKSAFPTAEVYGPTADRQLRLITCGGTFDRSRHSYVDDVVVFARATGLSG